MASEGHESAPTTNAAGSMNTGGMGTNGQEGSSTSASDIAKDKEKAIQAQQLYENGGNDNWERVLQLLEGMGDAKAVQLNRFATKFMIKTDPAAYLSELTNCGNSDDLDIDQQVLIDYNKALISSKHDKYDGEEAFRVLGDRVHQFSEVSSVSDELLLQKLYLLLAVLYLEKRKDPTKALPLLQIVSEKNPNLQNIACPPQQGSSNMTPNSTTPASLSSNNANNNITNIGINSNSNATDVLSVSPPLNRLQQIKAKAYLQLNSSKSARRELKSITGESLTRSYMEMQRSNFKKATKMLQSAASDSFPKAYLLNNEAILHFASGARIVATQIMSKALSRLEESSQTGESRVTAAAAYKLPYPEMLYNLSMMHHQTGNFDKANHICKILTSKFFPRNPRLWLRLAECSLYRYHKLANGLGSHEANQNKKYNSFIEGYAGEGEYRRLVLKQLNKKYPMNGIDYGQQSDGHQAHLNAARSAALNAHSLLSPNHGSTSCVFYPSNVPTETELRRLKTSISLLVAYTSLCLNDHILAHKFANAAIAMAPEPNGYQTILGHLYAGEACLYLDKINEAMSHFSPELLVNLNPEIPSSQGLLSSSNSNATSGLDGGDSPGMGPPAFSASFEKKCAETRVAITYNLSLCYVLRGDYERAKELLREVGQLCGPGGTEMSTHDLPIHTIMLSTFIELSQGRVDLAKQILRQHFPQLQ